MIDEEAAREHYRNLNANPPFDLELALRVVVGLDVKWREEFNNCPDLIVQMDEGIPLNDLMPAVGGYRLYKEFGEGQRKIFYGAHPAGFVKYFAHSGREGVNEGGFCGAVFGVLDTEGKFRNLQGPWSSRATAVNTIVPKEDAIVDVLTERTYCGFKVEGLKQLATHFKPAFSIVRELRDEEEKGPWTASLSPTGFVKPGGKSYGSHRATGIECLYNHETGEVFDV